MTLLQVLLLVTAMAGGFVGWGLCKVVNGID